MLFPINYYYCQCVVYGADSYFYSDKWLLICCLNGGTNQFILKIDFFENVDNYIKMLYNKNVTQPIILLTTGIALAIGVSLFSNMSVVGMRLCSSNESSLLQCVLHWVHFLFLYGGN